MPKVFISRLLKKNSQFQKLINGSGIESVGQSLIHFSPTPFTDIPKVDWVFFYSKNGVRFFLNQVQQTLKFQKQISSVKWAVMGKGTANSLIKYGYQPDFIGSGHPNATASQFGKLAAGQKVLFIQAKTSKKSVQQLLQEKLTVYDLVVYNNQIKADFHIPPCEYLVFTSPLNAEAYYKKYGIDNRQKVIAIGNTTAKALVKLGVQKIGIADKPTEKAMAQKVLELSAMQHQTSIFQNTQSMRNRYAVIDLGTNTFHLLVAEKSGNKAFKEIHRQRFYVKLAEEGIETIGAASIQRGLHALKTFRGILDKLGVKKIKALGTAALRTATNGPAFIQKIKKEFDIQVEIIDGNREAELIYKGVVLAVPFKATNYLLMDIGGGSVEFIIANDKKMHWAQSFPIGLAVLFKKIHQQDPISQEAIETIYVHINSLLSPLYQALIQFPVTTLVGAAGTFDELENILAENQGLNHHAYIKAKDFKPLYNRLIKSTLEERYKMKDIPNTRADMIVVAVILIEFILRKTQVEEIIVSNFALKEGVIAELMG